jgi:predicted RNase H-like nuclease (RuvC/YqgF family)
MKKLLHHGFYVGCISALIGMNVLMGMSVATVEVSAERWHKRVASYNQVQELNREVRYANEYSQGLADAVRMLALENGILCERDKAATEVVVQYEEESRRLKMSLAEACKRLEEQVGQINDLTDEVEDLRWQVDTLEKALDKVKAAEPDQSDKKGNTEQ